LPAVPSSRESLTVVSGTEAPRAEIVGTGLIGGSIGLALRTRGWHVSGWDADPARAARAAEVGALDTVGPDPSASITFVATPAGAVVEVASGLLDGRRVVTDVAGIKGPIVDSLADARFVGGHPMAGSEQEGVDGADGTLFEGATWVLTPTETTDPQAYATVQTVVRSLGAGVVAVAPHRHDDLVAVVSHVPHLAAATLMNLAADTALEHATLLRLAAGGFRDAILTVLDQLLESLGGVRDIVAKGDRDGLLVLLERARQARQNLPVGAPPPSETVEVRVPVPDRPAVLAEVTTLLGELGVNIYDFEIAHSSEGDRGGVIIMVVAASAVPVVREVLTARGYRVSARRLSS
jgi:prephenate dehydrogenase